MFSALLLSIVLSPLALMAAEIDGSSSVELCFRYATAKRKAIPVCSAERSVRPARGVSEGGTACLSAELWRRWLATEALPLSGCLRVKARWRPARGPLEFRQLKRGAWEILEIPQRAHPIPTGEVGRILDQALRKVERMRTELSRRWSGMDRFGVIRSVFLGERAAGEHQNLLRSFGWVHLFNATGLHLYALFSVIRAVGFSVASRFELPAREVLRATAVLQWSIGISLWILGGLRWGMLRPLVVLGLRRLALARGYRWSLLGSLALLGGLEGAYRLFLAYSAEPEELGLRGALHYFLAVAGGLIALDRFSGRDGRPGSWREHAAMAWGSWVGVAVYEIIALGWIAPWTPVLNFIGGPLVLFAILPLAAWGAFAPEWGALFSFPLEFLLELSLRTVPRWGGWFNVSVETLLPAALLAFVFFAIGEKKAKGFVCRARAALVLVMFVIVLRLFMLERTGRSEITVVQRDVGQGDAAWVLGRGRAEAIDVGSLYASSWLRWVEELSRHRIVRLDHVAITHWDEDHAGGLERLAALVPVKEVSGPFTPEGSPPRELEQRLLSGELAPGAGVRAAPAKDALVRRLRELRSGPERRKKKRDGNAQMAGYWVELPSARAYLNLGDASVEQERAWWKAGAFPEGRRWILKASHHGSRFSSDPGFLEALKPERIWISSGTGNTYGHPTVEALGRLRATGAKLERMDRDGELSSSEIREGVGRHR